MNLIQPVGSIAERLGAAWADSKSFGKSSSKCELAADTRSRKVASSWEKQSVLGQVRGLQTQIGH